LYHLARELKPAIALEIGIEWGTASEHLIRANSGIVVGIDVKKHRRLARLKKYSSFIFLHSSSIATETVEMVTNLVNTFGKIGLVFQDSSHHYIASCQEWELYRPLLADDAIWVCDDITPAFYNTQSDPPGKGMVQYFEERPGRKKLYPDVLHRGNCQGIILL